MLKKLIVVIFLIGQFIISMPLGFSETVDEIVAVVNDDVITQADINEVLLPIYAQYKSAYSDEELIQKLEKVRKDILKQMIEDKLILQQASKKNIKASEEEVDEKFNDVKSQFADAQEFEKILQSQGLTVSDLKDKYEEQIMIKKLINREVRSKINLSPTEIYQYYKEHKEDFKIPAKAEVQTILIRKKDADNKQKDADKERIEEIKKMLEEEENFSELALKYSEDPSAEKGGKMGYIKKDEMMDKVDKVIFSLEEGETSDIIETSVGYHIFKITDKKAGSIKSFEEARPEIENILFQDKAKARYSNWMESLKENAYISIK